MLTRPPARVGWVGGTRGEPEPSAAAAVRRDGLQAQPDVRGQRHIRRDMARTLRRHRQIVILASRHVGTGAPSPDRRAGRARFVRVRGE
ncbi:hypothetical protein CAE01nite_26240 [Cellulomonas aerilata]|uniref:Uncharacterized protein n=1 Tax=Cellulomonas aerilata TaxID=515326 RepID=A0A512DEK5_9CELL|nr:hypothetical protein CAE01nite_26240 [Cellulomonas aerilata]